MTQCQRRRGRQQRQRQGNRNSEQQQRQRAEHFSISISISIGVQHERTLHHHRYRTMTMSRAERLKIMSRISLRRIRVPQTVRVEEAQRRHPLTQTQENINVGFEARGQLLCRSMFFFPLSSAWPQNLDTSGHRARRSHHFPIIDSSVRVVAVVGAKTPKAAEKSSPCPVCRQPLTTCTASCRTTSWVDVPEEHDRDAADVDVGLIDDLPPPCVPHVHPQRGGVRAVPQPALKRRDWARARDCDGWRWSHDVCGDKRRQTDRHASRDAVRTTELAEQ